MLLTILKYRNEICGVPSPLPYRSMEYLAPVQHLDFQPLDIVLIPALL